VTGLEKEGLQKAQHGGFY